ncbi:MAG: 5,10-methylenetetrahydrofolate reductase, partial [uncultured Gemmatimonadaceae bacterium]
VGGDRSAARGGRLEAAGRRGDAARRRGGRDQRARRAARAEPDGGDHDVAAHRAAGGDRDGDPLRLPRPQPAGDVERPPRRLGGGAAQHPAHHRRPAEDGPLPGRHGGVRHRRDRAHEPGAQPEPRHGPRRQLDRRADALRDRRGGEPGGARPRARAATLRVQGRSGGRVRDHAAGVRRRAARAVPGHGGAHAHPDGRRRVAAGLGAQRGVPRQRGAGRHGAGRDDRADAARERALQGARRRRGDRDRARAAGAGARERAGGAGERPIRPGGAGAAGVRGPHRRAV